ncbi:MAG: hypothetical protein M1814_002731 [Vezdaea aestivalis]|nr:MAG: hypothetical protein M1814_002731 [Vezdaea aestivalis]
MVDGPAPDIAPPPPVIPSENAATLSYIPSNKSAGRLASILSRTSGLDSSLLALQYPLLLLLAPPRRAPSHRLKALASLLSDVRIFLRLPGLLKIYLWALGTFKSPPQDTLVKGIVWAQISASTVFQALENVAYLSQHGIIGLGKKTQSKAWKWSARAWAAHIFLDLLRLARTRELRRERGRRLADTKTDSKVVEKEEDQWRHEVLVNLAYAPLTIHYSLESAPIGEQWIGLLGSVVGMLGWRRLWRDTKA